MWKGNVEEKSGNCSQPVTTSKTMNETVPWTFQPQLSLQVSTTAWVTLADRRSAQAAHRLLREIITHGCFKPLSFRMVCYVAIDNYKPSKLSANKSMNENVTKSCAGVGDQCLGEIELYVSVCCVHAKAGLGCVVLVKGQWSSRTLLSFHRTCQHPSGLVFICCPGFHWLLGRCGIQKH